MAATSLYPLVGASLVATQIQTLLAASKLRLVTGSFIPAFSDTAVSLEAIEATYDGYTAGGVALTTWLAPLIDPLGGVSITSPQVQFNYVAPGSGTPVTNTVTGWFLTDAAGALVAEGSFSSGIPMVQNGDGFPISLKLAYGTLNQLIACWVFGELQQ